MAKATPKAIMEREAKNLIRSKFCDCACAREFIILVQKA